MTDCKIRGPHLPVGDTDWECVLHEVNARLKAGVEARIEAGFQSAGEVRRSDFYCPVGQIVDSLAEVGIEMSAEQLAEVVATFNEPEPQPIDFSEFGDYAGISDAMHRSMQIVFDRPDQRYWQAGDYRPQTLTAGQTFSMAYRGAHAEGMFLDEAFSNHASGGAMDVVEQSIGAQISIRLGSNVTKAVDSLRRAAQDAEMQALSLNKIWGLE